MSEWQPIETAPTNGDMLLLFDPSGYDMNDPEEADGYYHAVATGWWGNIDAYGEGSEFGWLNWHEGYCEETGQWATLRPTHWMYFPKAPT